MTTVKILETYTGKLVDAKIEIFYESELSPKEKRAVFKCKGESYKANNFNKTHKMYKLTLVENNDILGLMSVINETVLTHCLEIQRIDVSKENIGRNKNYDYIAGCLISFACHIAMKRHLKGVVLISLKKLKNHYETKYGMVDFFGFLTLDKMKGEALIKKYL